MRQFCPARTVPDASISTGRVRYWGPKLVRLLAPTTFLVISPTFTHLRQLQPSSPSSELVALDLHYCFRSVAPHHHSRSNQVKLYSAVEQQRPIDVELDLEPRFDWPLGGKSQPGATYIDGSSETGLGRTV